MYRVKGRNVNIIPSSVFSLYPLSPRFLFQTMYVLSCRVTPSGGGEICRAASICVLAIEIRKADPRAKDTTLMYEVSQLTE